MAVGNEFAGWTAQEVTDWLYSPEEDESEIPRKRNAVSEKADVTVRQQQEQTGGAVKAQLESEKAAS